MRSLVVVVLITLAACGDNHPGNITIRTVDELRPAIDDLAELTPYPLQVQGVDGDDLGGFRITVVVDPALPAQSFQLARVDDATLTVAAADVLGAQYGTAAALEALGFRFRHPFDTAVPAHPAFDPATPELDGEIHKPDVRVRGFQLHTLHPIESYFAFWEPGAANLLDAKRVIDWTIKNRGNFVQWVALDDILDPDRHAAWQAHTQAIIEYAHRRGVRVGLNIQLFGASNLQLAYDLVDDTDRPVPAQIAERLPPVIDGVDFDVYDLSFGEFFNSEPQAFIDAVDEVKRQLATRAPRAEMHAVVHVGADQRVTYENETLLYYFLVKFADPSIVPDVHTVMFYDLYEPTGGAYHHESFDEHRAFLLDRMCSGRPAAYFPETAYWVAFDNSVPQFFPLYVHNRWLDLENLAAEPNCSPLDNHLIFSSGWEWGFWLHDVTALRASFERPASSTELIAVELGPGLAGAVDPLARLVELQREHLMMGNLVAYVAGRDTAIDAGRQIGIVSQPDRVVFDDLATGVVAPAAFRADELARLEAYADGLDAIAADLGEPTADRWGRELVDGLAIDRVRARFVLATYTAALAHVEGDDADAKRALARAEALFADGQAIVTRRHDDLHDPHRRRLLDQTTNRTFYQFGYLYMADTLCYWDRELVQVAAMLGDTSRNVPSCLF